MLSELLSSSDDSLSELPSATKLSSDDSLSELLLESALNLPSSVYEVSENESLA